MKHIVFMFFCCGFPMFHFSLGSSPLREVSTARRDRFGRKKFDTFSAVE